MWWGVLTISGENSDVSALFCILISVISGFVLPGFIQASLGKIQGLFKDL